eukprot:189451-Rhodomonas_salina.6
MGKDFYECHANPEWGFQVLASPLSPACFAPVAFDLRTSLALPLSLSATLGAPAVLDLELASPPTHLDVSALCVVHKIQSRDLFSRVWVVECFNQRSEAEGARDCAGLGAHTTLTS